MVMRGMRGDNEAKRRLKQRHERAIAEKFNMSALDAIPSAMRPLTTGDLSYELLAKLSDLALVVPDVGSFRKALKKGWTRRISASTMRSSLVVEDIGTALELLGEEDSEEELLPYSRSGQSRVAADDDVPDNVPKERSSKTKAYQNIAGYVKYLKPPRKSSGLAVTSHEKFPGSTKGVTSSAKVQPDSNNVEVGNYPLPKRMINRQEVSASILQLSDPSPTLQLDRSKRKSELEGLNVFPQRPRTRAKESKSTHAKLPVSLLASSDRQIESDPLPSPTPTAIRRSNRERNKKGTADGRRMSRQEEHAIFFEMPKDQHYKTTDPRILNNPLRVSTFEDIKYPIEVPNPDRKGEYWEMHNEGDLREHIEMLKARIPSVPGSSVEHSEDVPTGLQQAVPSLKGRLDAHIQKLFDSLLSVFAEAYRAQGSDATYTTREQLESLNDELTRDIRAAKEHYEDGLRNLGVLPELAFNAEQEVEEGYVPFISGAAPNSQCQIGRPRYDGADDLDEDYSAQVEEQIARKSNRY